MLDRLSDPLARWPLALQVVVDEVGLAHPRVANHEHLKRLPLHYINAACTARLAQ